MNFPRVSLIMPCRNEASYIHVCLQSILNGSYPLEQLEILVVDGQSDDGTAEIVLELAKSYPLIKLLLNPQRTVPYAMNLGIKAASGEIIVRLDSHAAYPADYIQQLIFWLAKLNADNVGGVLTTLAAKANSECQALAEIMSHPFGVGNSSFRIGVSEPTLVDTVPFGCYKAAIFAKIGFYDEQLTRNQDDELNARLVKHGGKIYLIPSIQIQYYSRSSMLSLWKMFYQYGYFKPLVSLKIGYPTSLRQLAPPLFVLALIGSSLLSLLHSSGAYLFGLVLCSYLGVNLIFSAKIARTKTWRIFPYLLIGFLGTHLSYGWGYLSGMVDFILRKKQLKKPVKAISLSR